MATNHDEISFRDMYHQFLLVKDIDNKTRVIIEQTGAHIRKDDNAMLLFGYVDQEMGISYEFLCAACVYDDGEVAFEPMNITTSFKFRYGSFQGDMTPVEDTDILTNLHLERANEVMDGYKAPKDLMTVRGITGLDASRAPGYPDDIVVYFSMDGYPTEGIWCRVVSIDADTKRVQMRMLNEPYAPFGRHMDDIVDVSLIKDDDSTIKAVAVL